MTQMNFDFFDEKSTQMSENLVNLNEALDGTATLTDFETYLKERMYDAEYKLHLSEQALTNIGLELKNFLEIYEHSWNGSHEVKEMIETIDNYFDISSKITIKEEKK